MLWYSKQNRKKCRVLIQSVVLLILWYYMLSREKCLGLEPRCDIDTLVFHAEQREVFRF